MTVQLRMGKWQRHQRAHNANAAVESLRPTHDLCTCIGRTISIQGWNIDESGYYFDGGACARRVAVRSTRNWACFAAFGAFSGRICRTADFTSIRLCGRGGVWSLRWRSGVGWGRRAASSWSAQASRAEGASVGVCRDLPRIGRRSAPWLRLRCICWT